MSWVPVEHPGNAQIMKKIFIQVKYIWFYNVFILIVK